VEKYIDRMESKEERYDLYIDLQIWPKATDMAFKLKDHMRLHEVRINEIHSIFITVITIYDII
jgi:hypothetical protein